MLVDTSVWIAAVLREPNFQALVLQMAEVKTVWIAAPSLVEAFVVIERRRVPDGAKRLDELLRGSKAEILPFGAVQARLAHEAFQRYGKGRHPAGLNFGDCLSYAAAKSRGARLLYVGDDFAQTDLA
ncbi:type II toxin-antitoxin system VapC family toxin [bacterium]|nr:MAG: type II toxin-antitoxin system VapC family toxin [bacterium]